MIVLDARFDGENTMTVDGEKTQVIPDALLMCLGGKPSEGKILISENSAVYIVNTQPDLSDIKQMISDLSDLCAIIGETPASQGNPINPTASTQIRVIKTQLDGYKLL